MLFKCFRRSPSMQEEDEVLLPSRRVSTKERAAAQQFRESHNARIIEVHTQHQKEITAVLDALTQDAIENDVAEDLDYNQDTIPSASSPPIATVSQPEPSKHDHIYLSGNESVPLSILVNGSAPTNISHIRKPSKPAPAQLKNSYSILQNRPKRSDPPDLDYTRHEIWNPVQKESYSIGGPDLPWKTGVIDLKIEADLLDDYIGWVRETRYDLRIEGKMISKGEIYGGKGWKGINRGDRTFFAKLEKELLRDFREIARETNNHDERFGKEAEDSIVIWDLVERLEKEEMERKTAASAAAS